MNHIDAMKRALEALRDYHKSDDDRLSVAMSILGLAIEQAERQEPVAWMQGTGLYWPDDAAIGEPDCQPLYTAPPQRQPLTQEEIGLLTTGDGWSHCDTHALALFARAIEHKHGIGGEA